MRQSLCHDLDRSYAAQLAQRFANQVPVKALIVSRPLDHGEGLLLAPILVQSRYAPPVTCPRVTMATTSTSPRGVNAQTQTYLSSRLSQGQIHIAKSLLSMMRMRERIQTNQSLKAHYWSHLRKILPSSGPSLHHQSCPLQLSNRRHQSITSTRLAVLSCTIRSHSAFCLLH